MKRSGFGRPFHFDSEGKLSIVCAATLSSACARLPTKWHRRRLLNELTRVNAFARSKLVHDLNIAASN